MSLWLHECLLPLWRVWMDGKRNKKECRTKIIDKSVSAVVDEDGGASV